LVSVLCLLFTTTAYAQLPPELSQNAHVELLTMSPGTAVHAVFGHSGLRFVDPAVGFDAVFNYGTFDPSDPMFIPKFTYGDMRYYLSVAGGASVVRAYASEERSIFSQQLALTPDQVARLYAAVLENLEPANRYYPYDFVRDNCSTRILELLREHAGLVMNPSFEGAATYRDLIQGYLTNDNPLSIGIDLVLGLPMDRVPSAAERTFLPYELMSAVDASTIGASPAVARTDTVLWIAPPETAERSAPWLAYVLWALAAVLALVAWLPGVNRWHRRELVDRSLLWFSGLLGLFLLFMWLGTMHTVTSWNVNLLWAFPVNAWAGWRYQKASSAKWYRIVAAVLCTVAIVSPLLPTLLPQQVPLSVWPLAVVLLGLHITRRRP